MQYCIVLYCTPQSTAWRCNQLQLTPSIQLSCRGIRTSIGSNQCIEASKQIRIQYVLSLSLYLSVCRLLESSHRMEMHAYVYSKLRMGKYSICGCRRTTPFRSHRNRNRNRNRHASFLSLSLHMHVPCEMYTPLHYHLRTSHRLLRLFCGCI